MRDMTIMIKPASGNCNLHCEYCFYSDEMANRKKSSYGYMSEETLELVISKTLSQAEGSCTFAFQGGEPTLCGIDFFRKAIALEEQYNTNHVQIYNAVQTNGYSLDGQWAQFFTENQFLVGVSLDGGPKVHDYYRKTASGKETFLRVMKGISFLREAGAQFNILCVVNDRSARRIRQTYGFYRRNGFHYLQFIPCLDPLGEPPGSRPYSLKPEVYGEFLIQLFELWHRDLQRGEQPYIRQFENYVGILLGRRPKACDMVGHCGKQYVTEADGSVYCCDFYVLDEYRLGNFHDHTLEEMDRAREEKHFIEESLIKPEACQECQYASLCRGGCRRTRQEENGYRQYFCKSYQMFFEHCLPDLVEIARRIR